MPDATEDKRKLLGITPDSHISSEVAPLIAVLQAEGEGAASTTAREVMEHLTKPAADSFMPTIKRRIHDAAPDKPNGYSDGSLKNVRGMFWSVGGAGVWWPNRTIDSITVDEATIAVHRQVEPDHDWFGPHKDIMNPGGLMLWTPFSSRLNSSTRCELGAVILALLAPFAINIGVDNATVVDKGNAIIQHLRDQEDLQRHDEEGTMILGGNKSRLHRSSPFKQKWALMRGGDLWETFAEMVKRRGPHSVTITKVKGHATDEMVAEGKVELEDKRGNDQADGAAGRGATTSQAKVQAFGTMYCKRQKRYRKLVCKIQNFIVGLKEEERRLREEAARNKDPMEVEASKGITIPKQLQYPEPGVTHTDPGSSPPASVGRMRQESHARPSSRCTCCIRHGTATKKMAYIERRLNSFSSN